MTKEELEKEAEEKAKEFSEHPLKEFCKFPLHWTNFDKAKESCYISGYLAGAEPREKQTEELKKENERITTKYYELQETLKNVRVALIQERVTNIMNFGKGGVEMFDDVIQILKGVSN